MKQQNSNFELHNGALLEIIAFGVKKDSYIDGNLYVFYNLTSL
jgi:hypothetical protein